MSARDEEYALANRLSGYADAIVAFSIVNAVALFFGFAEPDVRCSLAGEQILLTAIVLALQSLYAAGLLGLRKAEARLRRASGMESSELTQRTRRAIEVARVAFVALSGLVQAAVCWAVLDGHVC